MSRLTEAGSWAAQRSISCCVTMMSPLHLSSFSAYSRTAASPRRSISASISSTTLRALAVSVSGVFVAFFTYSIAMVRMPPALLCIEYSREPQRDLGKQHHERETDNLQHHELHHPLVDVGKRPLWRHPFQEVG